MKKKLKLLVVSARFLFPADCGGKIRTGQILRGMKGGRFEITLASPGSKALADQFSKELGTVADRFVYWPEVNETLRSLIRLRYFGSNLPLPVASDRSAAGCELVFQQLDGRPDVVVFDFPHAAVLAPENIKVPSVLFTHNVEAEIFSRHAEVAKNRLFRYLWNGQFEKMRRFEKATLLRFDSVVAVSERDQLAFKREYGLSNSYLIPTGVDLSFFNYEAPSRADEIVFVGSMDWLANIDGIEYFRNEVWPLVVAEQPVARMRVVGRNPPASLVSRTADCNWTFTGFVDDVRTHVAGSAVCVIPLRVGGGTRIKAFEAMAMGVPIVSTSIGVEGLTVENHKHYLRADSAQEFAAAIIRLLRDSKLRMTLSRNARALVERDYSFHNAAEQFAQICLHTFDSRAAHASPMVEFDSAALSS